MRDQETRRPIPTEQSILWKPLHDSHYVVASLQGSDGGRRKIFVLQQVIDQVEALVRGPGRHAIGLLVGNLYCCPNTGQYYMVIESIAASATATDENHIGPKIAEALAERSSGLHTLVLGSNEHHGQVLGWYRGAPTIDAKPSLTTAGIHASLFTQPWQTTLVIAEGGGAPGGAFLLHDTVNSRWFFAPFYELLGHAPTPSEPKPTFISWPQYLTAESVTPAVRAPAPAVRLLAAKGPKKVYERPVLRLTKTKANDTRDTSVEPPVVPPPQTDAVPARLPPNEWNDRPVADLSDVSDVALADHPPVDRPTIELPPVDQTVRDAAFTDRVVSQATYGGLADGPSEARGRPTRKRSRGGDKLSIVDDRDQRGAGPMNRRVVGEDEDTTPGDDPDRYIEIARAEGFFIAGRFDARGEDGRTETIWVMNEPYSGMLLSVITTETEVVDATLHYNLRTDDTGLTRTPFPEHRDAESKTVYGRESCIYALRARCRSLRSTNDLVKEWKVTPPISFLSPAEWEAIPASGGGTRGARAGNDLNAARIAELPPGVRSQFRLAGGDEASA